MNDSLRSSLEAAARFLIDRRCDDGAWRDFDLPRVGAATAWTTAYVASRLARAATVTNLSCEMALSAAGAFLLRNCSVHGGWGYNGLCPCDADSTAQALLFLEAAPLRHVSVLVRHQSPCGGFRTYLWPPEHHGWGLSHPEVTATALLALARRLNPEHVVLRKGAGWLRRRLEGDPASGAYWWVSREYLALEVARLSRAGFPAPLVITDDAPSTRAFDKALALERLLISGCSQSEAIARAGPLLAMQQADGGWPGDAGLRLPRPDGAVAEIFFDENRVFTTATVVSALAAFDQGRRHPR